MNSRVSLKHLNARIAEKVANTADSLPYPIETEPAHKGRFFDDSAVNQGRGPTPTQWRVIDAAILSICISVLYWVLMEATS
jgi:hypothetical protein